MTLSGARELKFDDVSNLIAHVPFLLKKATVENIKMRELEQWVTAEKINNDRLFSPETEDPLDGVIEILNDPNAEHKKSMFPYELPQLSFDQVNDVATE